MAALNYKECIGQSVELVQRDVMTGWARPLQTEIDRRRRWQLITQLLGEKLL